MGDRRVSPRSEVSLECMLRRSHGAPIRGRTVDLGPGGMSVATDRPLATDEVLRYDLGLVSGHVLDGRARVLRQHAYGVYALRFEGAAAPVGSQAVA